MKHFFLFIITLLNITLSSAQISYESPHVKDGKTMKFTLPKGYFEVLNATFAGTSMYLQKENVDAEVDDLDALNLGVLSVLHVEIEDQTLDSLVKNIKNELYGAQKDLSVIDPPKIVKIKGRDCFFTAAKGTLDEEVLKALYFEAMPFGDYFILFSYYANSETEAVMSYDEFKKIIGTWSEVATDREDEMYREDYDFDDYDEEEYETGYLNDYFETSLTYYDILPDYGDLWDEPFEDNSHLLAEFVYKDNNGSVKTFSGGAASDYPSKTEMAKAIQKVLGLNTGISLKLDSEFANEDHSFKLYSITGGGTNTSVYTTEVNGELVFFVIDGRENPLPDFKPAVRDFMITMWVDYVDYTDWEDEEDGDFIDEE